jgi:diketogulonate reductase-like aldo/keto reductase
MEELVALTGGENVATDQVLYNLTRRGPEYDLFPWCRQRRIPIMAYSPIEQGRILKNPELEAVAVRHSATSAQVALAWVLQQEGVIAIPKAGTARHARENRGALEIRLTKEDMDALDRTFPPPTEPRPLEML